MKKLITKYWGVVLVVVLLSTLFVGAAPVANAGTLAWTTAANVNPVLSNQVVASDVGIIKVASNGDIFVVDNQTAGTNVLWKSTNGGYSWTAAVGIGAGRNIADIVLSPSYASDGYVYALTYLNASNDNTLVYQSATAGASFVQLGGFIGVQAVDRGMSIALPPTFASGVGEIMVATAGKAVGDNAGGIYIWGQLGILNWTGQGAPAADYTAAVYSPSYPIDQTIIAIGANAGGVQLMTKVFTGAWNADFLISVYNAGLDFDIATAALHVISTAIVLPADFNASNPLTRTFYVAVSTCAAGGPNDGVYRTILNPGAAATIADIDAGAADIQITSVAYTGATAAGTLFAGQSAAAAYSSNAAAGGALAATSWIPGGAVTGVSSAVVAVSPSYASNMTLYVGTTGAESAFNVSNNAGLSFYQTGLIDTALTTIEDFQVASATEWFQVTSNAGANNALWKTTDAGVTWKRVLSVAPPAGAPNTFRVRLSQNYTTDKNLYFFSIGAAGAAAPALRYSNDNGTTWAVRFFPAALSGAANGVGDVVVVDEFKLYVGDIGAANVYMSANNAFFWTAQALLTAGNVVQLKYNAASGDVLAGRDNGTVQISTNGSTWAAAGVLGAAGLVNVAFDANYATNNVIYASIGVGGAVASVLRFTTTLPAVGWVAIGGVNPVATFGRGIVVAADGTLYAADANPAAAAAGGIVRIMAAASAAPVVDFVASGDGLTLADTLASIVLVPGTNTVYAIENVGADKVVTYSDTMTLAVPTVASPADGAVVTVTGFNVVVIGIPGAPVTATYQARFDTRPDFLTSPGLVNFAPITNIAVDNTLAVAGSTVYYQVRMSAPVFGPWSATYTTIIELAPAAPNAPPIVAGTLGTTGAGGTAVALAPTFNWGGVPGATGFEFQLSMNPAMTELLVDNTGADALPATTAYRLVGHTLLYNTSYYWRVRGISGTSATAWSDVQSFTTMEEPAPVVTPEPTTPAPVITPIINLPTPTVVIPAATTVTKEINPTYIWAIIIIGAVLVLAVIVLIVRTRRSV